MKVGDILYTGHVATQAEARQYNKHQDDCDKIKRMHPFTAMKSGTLANRSYNKALDNKHKLFEMIAIHK